MSEMNYECGRCRDGINDDKKYVKLICDKVEIVKEFRYMGDMLGKYDSIGEAVTSRIRAG